MSRPRRAVSRAPSPLVVLGLVLLLAVLATTGWGVWQYWGSSIVAEQAAGERLEKLRADWEQQTEPSAVVENPQPGGAYWIMRIPTLGQTWEWPVAAGVGDEQLADALGWYPQTAQPGQVGNFAVAGGCITGAQPFRELRSVQAGDEVIVETATDVHTYEINSAPADLAVAADESWVLDPVPGQTEAEAVLAIITLTTCEDLYPTPDRSVAFGVLTSTEPK